MFNQLGYPVGNPTGTSWKFVPCPITGNVIVRVKPGNPNELFLENVDPRDHRGRRRRASRTSYGAWHFSSNLSCGAALTLTDAAESHAHRPALEHQPGDQNQDTGKQFPACQ